MNAEQIGQRLIQLRGNQRREEVAYKVGISVSALALYEAGKRIPKDSIKIALANYYGVTVEALFYA